MKQGANSHAVPDAAGRCRLPAAVPVLLIIVLAVAVRIYRLREQALCFDDFMSFFYLGAPDLSTYVGIFKFVSQDNLPLYFTMQYFWSHLVGGSPAAVRLLPIIINVLTVPMLYVLGREIFGRKAGLVAAFCLALSPMQISYSQAFRPYSLIVLLAAISMYAMLKALRNGGFRWWCANVLANFLMMWLHPFVVFFFFAEGCFLLVFLRRRLRETALWVFAHALTVLPSLIWLALRLLRSQRSAQEWFLPTNGWDVLVDLLADDAICFNGEIAPSPTTWGFIPDRWAQAVLSSQHWFGWALLLLTTSCVLWLSCRIWRALRGSMDDTRARDALESAALLLSVWGLPVLALAAVSVAWRPCFGPRFTMYGSLALYTIIGGAFAGLPWAGLRKLAVAALIFIYGLQLSLLLPAVPKTDWYGATEYIESNASLNDVIVFGYIPTTADILRFHMASTDIPILRAYTDQAACEKAAALLGRDSPDSLGNTERTVWLVFLHSFQAGCQPGFPECLTSRGLSYSYREFPALESLGVYRVTAAPDFDAEGQWFPTTLDTGVDYEAVLLNLQADTGKADEWASNVESLRRTLNPAIAAESLANYCLLGAFLALEGNDALAFAATRKALGLQPELAAGVYALQGILAWHVGEDQMATDAFGRAFALNDFLAKMLEPLFVALCQTKDYKAARAEVARLEGMGIPLAALRDLGLTQRFEQCREVFYHDRPAAAHYRLGLILEAAGDVEGAAAAYANAAAADPKYAGSASFTKARALVRHGGELEANGDLSGAIDAYCDAAALYPKSVELSVRLAKAYEENGDTGEAIRCFREAVAASPEVLRYYDRLDALYAKDGSLGPQVAPWREIVQRHADVARPRYCLAVALEAAGDLEGALDAYGAAHAIDSGIYIPHQTFMRLGQRLKADGNLDAAEAAYNKAGALNPKDPEIPTRLGEIMEARGDTEAATRFYRGAMALDPGFSPPYSNLDAIHLRRNDHEGRIAQWRDVITANPGAARAHFHLAMALEAKHDVHGAAEAYRKASELEPADPAMRVNLGLALTQTGDFHGAAAAFKAALELNPDMPRVRIELIRALCELEEYDAAEQEAQACRKQGIELPQDLSDNLARVLDTAQPPVR